METGYTVVLSELTDGDFFVYQNQPFYSSPPFLEVFLHSFICSCVSGWQSADGQVSVQFCTDRKFFDQKKFDTIFS